MKPNVQIRQFWNKAPARKYARIVTKEDFYYRQHSQNKRPPWLGGEDVQQGTAKYEG